MHAYFIQYFLLSDFRSSFDRTCGFGDLAYSWLSGMIFSTWQEEKSHEQILEPSSAQAVPLAAFILRNGLGKSPPSSNSKTAINNCFET